MSREEREVRRAHAGHGLFRGQHVVHAAVVLVNEDQLAAAEARTLIHGGRDHLHIGQHRPVERVVVNGPADTRPSGVQREVKGNPERSRPVAFDHVAFQVDADHLVRTELVPRDEPRIAQEGPVADVARDVTGQVVVVTLAPEAPSQEYELLSR